MSLILSLVIDSWRDFLVTQMIKNLPPKQETWVPSLDMEDPLEKGTGFLPGEFHGQRSLAGYSLWGCKESDRSKQLSLTQIFLF